ncbi:MAG: hypothetical protein NTV21_16525 [Planctomycetota bacterium]|nr:hypothetical protein [Planctomycetota bacterium]
MQSRKLSNVTLAALALGGFALAQDGSNDRLPPRLPTPTVLGSQTQTLLPVGSVQVIHTSITGSPTAVVPGIPGLTFPNTSGHLGPFDRPFGSANGHWIIAADSDAPTTADDLLLLDNVVVEREGNVASWATVAGSTMGPFQTKQGVNTSGTYIFKNNTSEASTADDYVVTNSAGTYTVNAREGLDIPQLPGAELWNDNLENVQVTNTGVVSFEANLIQNPVSANNDEIFVSGANLLYLEDTTVPTGQLSGLSDAWDNLFFEDAWVSADGLHVVMKGDLLSATTIDDVIVYDGAVVLQEGFVIPGSGFANPVDASGIVEVGMGFDGAWFARGNNDITEEDWVVRNGVVIARVGGPVLTSGTELWDDTTFADGFFAHQGDSNGNWVVGGVTDNVDPLRNGVLVLNGTTELVREGDPIDVDGNGLFDNDAFFNTFGNDDLVLFDNGDLVFVASIRNALGTAYAQGLFRVSTTGGSTSVVYCTAGTSTNGCVPAIASAGTPSAAAASGFTLTVSNVEGQKQGLLFYGISGRASTPWGINGSSFLCVKSPTQRMGTQPTNGTLAQCDGSLSIDWLNFVAANPSSLGAPFSSGTVVQAQGWYRDPPAVKTTNLSDALEFTLVP